jgi:hypothetical protein
MSAHDEIGPVDRLHQMPNWKALQLAERIRGIASAAAEHARKGDPDSARAARRGLAMIQQLLGSAGDE